MKILLTGQPKSGKTTLLAKLIAQVEDKQGLVAVEVCENDKRIGFDLKDSTGKTALLSRVNQTTPYPVGRYFVDIESLDNFIEPLFAFSPSQLLYIDEIGQMQLYSDRFKELVNTYLHASNHFVGTITSIYSDEFVENVKNRQDILICEVTLANRAELEQGLTAAVKHRDMIGNLSVPTQEAILHMATTYLNNKQNTYFRKLFKNAVPYCAQSRIRLTDHGFIVEGDTNNHHVDIDEHGNMICDCDLFNGRGKFEGKTGMCSHVQAAQLLKLQS